MTPLPPWALTPEALALLASIRRDPPQRDLRTGTFERSYPPFRVDARVKRLRALYRAAEPEVDSAEWVAWLKADEQAVIAAALAEMEIAA